MARFLPAEIEQLIVWERLHLYNRGLPCGAIAIRLRLNLLGIQPLPSVSSINVSLGEWEKIPRLQAKTLVGLRYETLPQKQSLDL